MSELDEFLKDPKEGATVWGLGGAGDGAWICIYPNDTACLDGFFTAEELIKIAAAIEKAKA